MMTINQKDQPGIKYLDMQAYVGITKHNGGFEATNELLALCHIGEAQEVLNADRFDVTFCESVLAFVEDKQRAIRECVRVTKPGGYVGLNETYFVQGVYPELVARAQASVETGIPTAATWQMLWEQSGLRDRVVRLYQIDPRKEIKDRIQWVGWRWAAGAWGRLLRLYITKPTVRQSLREMFDAPLDMVEKMGYGLFVGRK